MLWYKPLQNGAKKMFNELVKGAIIAVFATLMLPQISTAQTEAGAPAWARTEAPVKKIKEIVVKAPIWLPIFINK